MITLHITLSSLGVQIRECLVVYRQLTISPLPSESCHNRSKILVNKCMSGRLSIIHEVPPKSNTSGKQTLCASITSAVNVLGDVCE